MVARGTLTIPCALTLLVVILAATGPATAWDSQYRFPVKVRVSGADLSDTGCANVRTTARQRHGDWESAAGAARAEILCPRRGYAFALGMRPFFSTLSGSAKVLSRGGEGTYLNLYGHLRIPPEKTLWEFYSFLKLWDKVAIRVDYVPWSWNGPGHIPNEGNFAGLLLRSDDSIQSDLAITQIILGADYDVSFSRELVFGPNADLHVLKWSQRVAKEFGQAVDFSQTMLQPAIGAHIRYDPLDTGYFSWFKPYVQARLTWMSFNGLGLSTWDFGAGVAPPISRNVDAGIKLGYKQWKLDGNRGRFFADVAVEGPYLDLDLRF